MQSTQIFFIITMFLLLFKPIIGEESSAVENTSQTQVEASKKPTGPMITDILINGNRNTAKQIIMVTMNSKVGQPLDEQTLKNDMRAIYKLGYFQTPPQVVPERYRGGLRLIITLEENPLVESVTLEGNTLIPTEDLLKEMTTKPGSVLNIKQLYEDLSLISADRKSTRLNSSHSSVSRMPSSA